jgi:trigger factor
LINKIYGEGQVTSEEQMKDKIREEMNREYQTFANSKLDREIQDALIDEIKVELPNEFLRRLLDENREEGNPPMDDQQFNSSLKQIKWDLISDKLIHSNELAATDEEMAAEAMKDVVNYFGGSSSYFQGNPDSLNNLVDSLLKDEKNASRLRSRVLNEKLQALLRSKVKTEEKTVDEHEFFHH